MKWVNIILMWALCIVVWILGWQNSELRKANQMLVNDAITMIVRDVDTSSGRVLNHRVTSPKGWNK